MSGNSKLPGSLVETDWVESRIGSTSLRIVDIRGYVKTEVLDDGKQSALYVGAPDEYEAGHIPGSVYIDWTTDIVDLDHPVKAQIAPPERFAAFMGSIGIGNETNVVVVDHSGGHFATRLWWTLRYHGHDRVAVMNGGFAKWEREQRPITTEATPVQVASFVATLHPEMIADADDIQRMAGSKSDVIVDARDPAQYVGEMVRGSRGGHIPGAVNLPAKTLVHDDGTWRADDELRTAISDAGIASGQTVTAYCNGGVTATAVLFALDRIGHTSYANYDGSWNEWGERPELPVEVGAK